MWHFLSSFSSRSRFAHKRPPATSPWPGTQANRSSLEHQFTIRTHPGISPNEGHLSYLRGMVHRWCAVRDGCEFSQRSVSFASIPKICRSPIHLVNASRQLAHLLADNFLASVIESPKKGRTAFLSKATAAFRVLCSVRRTAIGRRFVLAASRACPPRAKPTRPSRSTPRNAVHSEPAPARVKPDMIRPSQAMSGPPGPDDPSGGPSAIQSAASCCGHVHDDVRFETHRHWGHPSNFRVGLG